MPNYAKTTFEIIIDEILKVRENGSKESKIFIPNILFREYQFDEKEIINDLNEMVDEGCINDYERLNPKSKDLNENGWNLDYNIQEIRDYYKNNYSLKAKHRQKRCESLYKTSPALKEESTLSASRKFRENFRIKLNCSFCGHFLKDITSMDQLDEINSFAQPCNRCHNTTTLIIENNIAMIKSGYIPVDNLFTKSIVKK